MRTIITQAGIGDCAWILCKLVNAGGEKFFFHLPDGQPQRGAQIFDLCPQVSAGAKYVSGLTYKKIERNSIHYEIARFGRVKLRKFYLSINKWLEDGKRIEGWLPDLPTSFLMDWRTSDEAKAYGALAAKRSDPIGLYCSAHGGNLVWSKWTAKDWARLCELVREVRKDATFIIIGAEWDASLASEVMAELDQLSIPYTNCIGETLEYTIEILKNLNYFIGYPSGISILNETLGKDGFMFYPEALRKMMRAWADPDRIASGAYLCDVFSTPEQNFATMAARLEVYRPNPKPNKRDQSPGTKGKESVSK